MIQISSTQVSTSDRALSQVGFNNQKIQEIDRFKPF